MKGKLTGIAINHRELPNYLPKVNFQEAMAEYLSLVENNRFRTIAYVFNSDNLMESLEDSFGVKSEQDFEFPSKSTIGNSARIMLDGVEYLVTVNCTSNGNDVFSIMETCGA